METRYVLQFFLGWEQAEKAKLRMREMRKRQKSESIKAGASKITTRKERVKLRERWRENKKAHRIRMTPQAKRREREQRRELYHRKKASTTAETIKTADSIEAILEQLTPRRKKDLKDKGILLTPNSKSKNRTNEKVVKSLRDVLVKQRKNKSKQGRQKYNMIVGAIARKNLKDSQMQHALGVQWHSWMLASQLHSESLPLKS